jgi:tetratricopeptide (TPR) repeat protein
MKLCSLIEPFAKSWMILALLLNFTLVCPATFAVDPLLNYMNKAKDAELTANFDQAQKYYSMALDTAKKSGNVEQQVRVLCALARMWTLKPDYKAAEPYYEEALKLAKAAKQQSKFDREILVWMVDLADAYYAASQRTFDNATKEYCVWRYSMIHLAVDSKATAVVFGNISKLAVYECMVGKYHEAEALCEPRISIYERTPGHDPFQLGQTWLILATVQVGARESNKAKASYANAIKLLHITGPSAIIDRQLGNLALFQSDCNQARAFYSRALQADQQGSNKPNPSQALDCYLLGLSYQQEKKNDLAEKYLKQSVAIMNACLPPRSEQLVFPYDELAKIFDKDAQKKPLKDKCLRVAQEIRSAHPECQKTTPAQQKDYYMIWGSMPDPSEISPSTQI